MPALCASSRTLTTWPNGASLFACMVRVTDGFCAFRVSKMLANSLIVIDLLFNRRCGARTLMLTNKVSLDDTTVLLTFRAVGSDKLIAGNRSLKVVLTTRKIRTTISTSISDTMIIDGAVRFIFCRNFIHSSRRADTGCAKTRHTNFPSQPPSSRSYG